MSESVREWLTPDDLANEVGVPPKTVYQWNSRGGGPVGTKIGRHIRYSRQAVDAWIAGLPTTTDRREWA